MPLPEVREIGAAETVEIRWLVLRAGLPRESAIFEGDQHSETRHYGCFVRGELQGVARISRAAARPQGKGCLQLRGMAVLPEARGHGCGSALLRECEASARLAGATLLWCNARTTAAEVLPAARFYDRR